MKKNIIQITEQDLHNLIKESIQKIIKENFTNKNELYSLVVEISPQTLHSQEDIDDYNTVNDYVENGDYQSAFNYMMQWEQGGDYGQGEPLDKYDEILYEDGNNVLTVCDSSHFGHQGNAYFLYRKENQDDIQMESKNYLREDFNNILRDYGTIEYADGGMEGLNFIKRMDYIRYALSKGYDVIFSINYGEGQNIQIKISHEESDFQIETTLGNFIANSPQDSIKQIIKIIKSNNVQKLKKNNYNRFKI